MLEDKKRGLVKRTVRKLLLDFPGVSSYSTVLKLLTNKGESGARKQLEAWRDAGTCAPRKG